MELKSSIYNRMLATRDELDPSFVSSASLDIQKKVLLMEEFRTVRRIGLYSPFGREVATDYLFNEGDKNRKELYFPAVGSEEDLPAYYRIMDLAELEPGMGGKLQPSGKQSRLRDIADLEAMIVPGIVFDISGARIGFGKGFYEENLKLFEGERIALAYDFQIVSELSPSAGGKRVDWIVTEKRIIRCR